ncbi:hypothetical protein [Sulfurirhabdus autotrophica]|uniref:Uncharacterized protein n=1 Tax=Sulfurirhabdus autotrophica TaxID=1706046 RepID=A0A4R3YC19_9PROT|nr:hypothetical protein [Sulfurirhabdus autotrophica]TCV89520.1 hypothetical protein EDC63_10237 [Sulfurirhabdus autotrophica]
MRNSKSGFTTLSIILVCLMFAGPSLAAKRDPEREAMRKIQLIQKKAAEEKSVLEQEKSDLAKQLSELTSQSGGLKDEAARANRGKNAVEKEFEKLRVENDSLKAKLSLTDTNLAALLKKSAVDQEIASQEKVKLEASLATRGQSLASCEKKNITLYELNVELLEKYKNKGFLDSLLQNEPFTQIESVKIESAVSDYRDKLDMQRVDKSSSLQ